MTSHTSVLDLAIVLCVAAVISVVMRLLKQSSVVGYLLAGLVVGPYIPIPLFAEPRRVESLAEFGVLLVMFAIGLEFRVRKFVQVIPTSGLTAVLQMSFLFWCGLSVGLFLDWSTTEAVFLGAAVCISSTMVVSKLFDQRKVAPPVRKFVFGVLVIQDLAAVVLIAVVTGIASGQGLAAEQLAATLGRLTLVLVGLVVGGMLFIPRLVRLSVRLASPEILVVVVTGLCFGIAVLAEGLGYSVALGAFVAGVLVAESGEEKAVEPLVRPLRDVFAAIFFVSIGMTVDPVAAAAVLPQSLLLVGIVILAQFASVSLAGVVSGNGLSRSLAAGLSLGQIGEFSFIIGGIGISAGIVRSEFRSMLVTAAIVTAFTTPLLFARAERLGRWVGSRLPARASHLLGVYERWFEAWRRGSGSEAARSPIRRAVRVILVDSVLLVGIAMAAVITRNEAWTLVAEVFPGANDIAIWALAGAWALLAAPVVVSLLRNTDSLAGLVSRSVVTSVEAEVRPATPLLQGTYRVLVWLGVLLTVGGPVSAILRPVVGVAPAVVILAGPIVAVALSLLRGRGDIETGFRSQAERVANLLAKQVGSASQGGGATPRPIPGFDLVFGVAISPESHVVGKTLIELNLRALTGATVVAIRRSNHNVLLPTGREALQAGDVLGIAGTEEAIRKANELITSG
ncbi:MAG: potassium transporter [Deltaproteobacteria bacterium]|nr:potassium transporter [Deltaproteobacteria bacterium]